MSLETAERADENRGQAKRAVARQKSESDLPRAGFSARRALRERRRARKRSARGKSGHQQRRRLAVAAS